MLHKSFNSAKCKTSLKLASARIKLLKNKRQQSVSQLRREISQLLETGQDQTARIRVEHVIREEKTVAAYEFIELFCELIAARLQIIETQKACPIDLKEAIASVMFASQRCPDVTELSDVRKRLAAKYGKEFVTAALELRPNCGVSSLMVEKLSVKAPDIETKLSVLTSIATEYGINWEPKSFEEQLKKTQAERLDGPSSFSAVKIVTEPTMSEFSVQSSHVNAPATKPPEKEVWNPVKHSVSSPTSSSVPAKPSEKEVQAPVTYSAFSTSSSVTTKQQTEPRPSESRYQPTQSENSYSRGRDDFSKLEQWNTEFTDASSAARAAAESAERANLAARAAAEFASQEPRNRQFVTGCGETSEIAPEIASQSKADNAQEDFKDPGFSSHRMKETSKVSKSSEHPSSKLMHRDYRAKNKAKEYLDGPRGSSSRSKSPSPQACDSDKPDPTIIVSGRSSMKHGPSSSQIMHNEIIEKYSTVSEDDEEDEEEMEVHSVGSNSSHSLREEEHLVRSDSSHYHRVDRSSLRITSEQVIKHGQSSSQMMQDGLIEKYITISKNDMEGEEEVHSVGSNSSHSHREEEHLFRSDSSHYHRASNDGNNRSDDKLSSATDRYGNNIHEEGIQTHNVEAQSGSEKIGTSFISISSPIDGNIHSAGENWKNDFYRRGSFDNYAETGDKKDNHQGIGTAVFDDYGPDNDDHIDLFDTSHDNAVELDSLRSKPADSSLYQDSWLHKITKSEPSIERHAHSHIFSPETIQAENDEDAREDSSLKLNEASSPKYDEPLLPKYDEIDRYDNSDSEDDKSSHCEEGDSTSTMGVSYPDREGSINLNNNLEDQIGEGLKLDSISGGFRNKGLVRPPYVRSSTESHPSKERVDDPSNRQCHGRKKILEKVLDEKTMTVESTSLSKDFEHSSDKLLGRDIHGKKSQNEGDIEPGFKSSRRYSDFGRSQIGPQPRSRLENSSVRLSGRGIYGEISHDADEMEQGSESSRQYSDFGSSKGDRQPRDDFERSSTDRLSGRRIDGKKSYDGDDSIKGSKSSRQYSDFSSSNEDSQPCSPVASRRTRTVVQSHRTKVLSMSNTDSRSILHQLDGETLDISNQPDTQMETKPPQSRSYDVKSRWNMKYNSKTLQDEGSESLDMSSQQDTETETKPLQSRSYDVESSWNSKYNTKPLQDEGADSLDMSNQKDTKTESKLPQSRSYDVKSRWNKKYNSKPLQDEGAEFSLQMDEVSTKESSESSLHGFSCMVDVREEMKTTSQTERHSLSYKTESGNSSESSPKHTVLADPETPSRSDVRNRWNRKFSQSSEKHLAPQIQRDEFSGKEFHASPSTAQPTVKEMPESDGSPAKSDLRNRWSNKYSPSQPFEVPPSQRNESSKELHAALPSTAQPRTKGTPEFSVGSQSKSDMRDRWSNKYSPSQPSEVPPAQRNESSKRETHATLPSTVQPRTNGTPESSDGSCSSKSVVQKRRSNQYTASQPSVKNLVSPVQRNESPKKELYAPPSAILPSAKGVPEALDVPFSKSDAQMRQNNKYAPPPSEKHLASPVHTDEGSGKESQPPIVQPNAMGISGSLNGSVKKEKPESQSSRQPPTTQPVSGAAGVQNVCSDLASAASLDSIESPRSPQASDGSPLPHVHKNLPDYDTFAARFKALKANHRKK